MEDKYYVYVYLDPRKLGEFIYEDLKFDFEPIYIGKGCNYRYRSHLYIDKTKKNPYLMGKIKNIKEINNLKLINNLYISINKLYEFTKKYNYNDLIDIDYKCNKLNNLENNFVLTQYKNNVERYKKELYFFNCRFIKYYNDNLQKLKSNKFYSNPDYILSDNETLSSLIISHILQGEINVKKRENFGYVLKTVLNDYNYNLFRNVLSIFYDYLEYNDLIKGKTKTILTFDEDLFDYIEKTVKNPDYESKNDKIKTEEFEEKHESKYNEIQELIKINKLIN